MRRSRLPILARLARREVDERLRRLGAAQGRARDLEASIVWRATAACEARARALFAARGEPR